MLTLWRYYHHKCGQLYIPALLEQLMVSQLTNPLQSVEAEVSFPYSKFISTCLYSEPDYSRQTLQFSVCRFRFNNILLSTRRSSKLFFPSVPTTKHFYIFLFLMCNCGIRFILLLFYCPNNIWWGTAVAQWLRCCATNRKVAGSISAGVSGFFIHIKSHYGPGVDSASNRNDYQEYFLEVKAAGA